MRLRNFATSDLLEFAVYASHILLQTHLETPNFYWIYTVSSGTDVCRTARKQYKMHTPCGRCPPSVTVQAFPSVLAVAYNCECTDLAFHFTPPPSHSPISFHLGCRKDHPPTLTAIWQSVSSRAQSKASTFCTMTLRWASLSVMGRLLSLNHKSSLSLRSDCCSVDSLMSELLANADSDHGLARQTKTRETKTYWQLVRVAATI
jgi:hypothetical protein